jgi:hypothetical protein
VHRFLTGVAARASQSRAIPDKHAFWGEEFLKSARNVPVASAAKPALEIGRKLFPSRIVPCANGSSRHFEDVHPQPPPSDGRVGLFG